MQTKTIIIAVVLLVFATTSLGCLNSQEEKDIRLALNRLYFNWYLNVDVVCICYDEAEQTAEIRVEVPNYIIFSIRSEYKEEVGKAVFDAVPELKKFTYEVKMTEGGGIYKYYRFSCDREDFL